MSRKAKPKSQSAAPSELDQAKALLEQVVAIIGTAPALTTKDRQRSAKLRKGGETVIPTLAALSDQHGLQVAAYPTSTMTAQAKQAASLIPLHKLLVSTTKTVADQMFVSNSESWKAATVHYTMLRRLSKSDGNLATTLGTVRQFFRTKSPSVVKAHDAKTGHERGVKTKKEVVAAPPAETAAHGTTESPAPVETPVAPTATSPAPVAATPVTAPRS